MLEWRRAYFDTERVSIFLFLFSGHVLHIVIGPPIHQSATFSSTITSFSACLRPKNAMNGTPRLRSAFPSTPSSTLSGRLKAREGDATSGPPSHSVTPPKLTTINGALPPLVPVSIVDAPTQRLYITLFYLGLTIWRLYDFSRLVEVETDSLWLFMKWVAVDSAFFYGLPALRVPWMQWSSSTTTILFLMHGALNAILMFRISVSGIPVYILR